MWGVCGLYILTRCYGNIGGCMRELKFRAWDKKRKCYAERIQTLNTSCPYHDRMNMPKGVMTFSKWLLRRYIIEQYTGLKDKNGKEIYEGDIMRFDAISYEIYWSDDFSGWHNRRTDGGERIYGSNSFEEVTRFGIVVGNIHENPEVLEEEKPRPVIANGVEYDSYADYLKSREEEK